MSNTIAVSCVPGWQKWQLPLDNLLLQNSCQNSFVYSVLVKHYGLVRLFPVEGMGDPLPDKLLNDPSPSLCFGKDEFMLVSPDSVFCGTSFVRPSKHNSACYSEVYTYSVYTTRTIFLWTPS